MFYDTFIIFDHLKQTVTIAAIDLFQNGRTQQEMSDAIETIYTDLQQGSKFQEDTETKLAFQPKIEQATFIEMVEKAKEHIVKGDIFQVVLSQRFSSPFEGNPFALYRQLRTSNPSPYMFYMDFEKYTILGTSPESLVKVNNGIGHNKSNCWDKATRKNR